LVKTFAKKKEIDKKTVYENYGKEIGKGLIDRLSGICKYDVSRETLSARIGRQNQDFPRDGLSDFYLFLALLSTRVFQPAD
jgi:hypothetical protein